MLAFVIATTIWMHHHRIYFHDVSAHRFDNIETCMRAGRRAIHATTAQMARYHVNPLVKFHLDCAIQITFES